MLFLTHYFCPEVGAAPTRILEVAQGLARRGHEITVLTGFPNYPDGLIPPSYRGQHFTVERLGPLRVVRTAVYPAPNRGLVRRLVNHASFALSSMIAAPAAGAADAVIVESPPLFAAAAGVAVAREKRSKMILHVADLWPDAAIELGAIHHRPVINAARALERFVYCHSDRIVVPTPGLKRILLERGVPPDRVLVAPHGVDPTRFDGYHRVGPVGRRIVYCGTLGMGHATGTLIEAVRLLAFRGGSFEVVIVGDGAERADLEAKVRAYGLDSVRFAGRMSGARIPELLATAEVAVVTQRNVPLLADALSTKVLEYMAAGRPIAASVSGWTAEIIGRAGAGVVCPPEEPEALANAIGQLAADPIRARAMGRQGRRYVEAHMTRAIAIERFEQALSVPGGASETLR